MTDLALPFPAGSAEGRRRTIHANALLVGAAGVLLRGPSGSGKSALTLELIALARSEGRFARLIGDDRVEIENRHGRLLARPHPAIAGAIEERGVGILPASHESRGVIRCVVDLRGRSESPLPRLPDPESALAEICGVILPRLAADAGETAAGRKIFSFIHDLVAF
ncbi:HPr kinase/phosphorylase [Methylosinus sp. Sm6]|uniref:HPr kinase/phosphorylase n=1 Tax=Methylosinus sp. Sm6 TaxID=2866948 RepID=UPI001C99521A|nr:HPr kinase/phosphatase C-terminal domain-containing protein [Methylosinus sp. Sm6]MBY6241081.1 HPr kinase/phosphatase C-terminal domain-containing protein [Methylosinus sp. Sm6]